MDARAEYGYRACERCGVDLLPDEQTTGVCDDCDNIYVSYPSPWGPLGRQGVDPDYVGAP